jgi:hypothetical protein
MLSLRNLVRAGEWGADVVQTDSGRAIRRQAVADFRRWLPDVVNARDVLEHFDDYATGRGRIQQRALRNRSVPETYSFVVEPVRDDVVIGVGSYRFSVTWIRDACRELTITLLAAEEMPHAKEAEALLDKVLMSSDEDSTG